MITIFKQIIFVNCMWFLVYMLWFNFILGSNFIFLCFKLIIIQYNTQKQKKHKIWTKDKIEPQQICRQYSLDI